MTYYEKNVKNDPIKMEKYRARARKWHLENKERSKEANKQWKLKNVEYTKQYMRKYSILKRYGMTWKQYSKLLEDQKQCCAICSVSQESLSYKFHVDHNHVTGKIRGLLCSKCNVALGQLNEDINLFNKAINYLRRSST